MIERSRTHNRQLSNSSPIRIAFRLTPIAYLITLSARYSIDCGIVRPICFAVLRFITSSNFVGCSTGKIGRLGTLQDSVHVICDAPVAVREVRPVVHEPTGIYSFSVAVHRR